MSSAMKKWFASPMVEGDEDLQRRIHLINAIFIYTIGIDLLLMFNFLLEGPYPIPAIEAALASLGLMVLIRYWFIQGKYPLVSASLITVLWFNLLMLVLLLGSSQVPPTATFILLVLLAGMLFQRRGILLTTIIAVLTAYGVWLAISTGAIPTQKHSLSILNLLNYGAILAGTAYLTYLSILTSQNTLRRAQDEIERRKQAETALQQASLYNRSLLEASLDPLVTIGLDGKITDVNIATEVVTGFSRAELIGTDFSDYFTDPEQARAGYQQIFRLGAALDYSLEIRHRDGRVIPVLYNATVYRDQDGEVAGIFAAARDVTELQKTQKELECANSILEQRVHERTLELENANLALQNALRVKDKFIGAMSHELRTPMNAILGFTQILLMDTKLQVENRAFIKTIHDSGEHLLDLINQTLEMSKINEGQVTLNPVNFNPAWLVQDVRSKYEARLKTKNLALRVEMQTQLAQNVYADQEKLVEILNQLLDNAYKYTQQGSVSIRCWTEKDPARPEPQDLRLWLEVEDSGVGMSAEEIARLFKPFEQTQEESKITSGMGFTGLGLAISQSYAHLMGGEISVESTTGVGSCFRVMVPVRASESADGLSGAAQAFPETVPLAADEPAPEPDGMHEIPQDLRDQMKSATANAHFDELLGLIDQASSYSPRAASTLRQLANDFQLDALLEMFESV